MNGMWLVRGLWPVAALMRRLGLRPPVRFGRWLLGLSAKNLKVEVDGFSVEAPAANAGLVYRFACCDEENYTRQLFTSRIAPGMTVLDIGANVGFFTLLAARQVGATGRVYAFEPDPRTFRYLQQNIRNNAMEAIVTVAQVAASDTEGTATFFLSKGAFLSGLFSSAFSTGDGATTTTVQTVRLDERLSGVKIDVVKMDIEGAELHALRGMRDLLTNPAVAPIMFVECNPAALSAAGGSAQELIDCLRGMGLRAKAINDDHKCLETIPDPGQLNQPVNLYCERFR